MGLKIGLVLPGFSAHQDDWAIPALQGLAAGLAQQHSVTVFSQRYPAKGRYHFAGLTHIALGGGQRFGLAALKLWLETIWVIAQQHKQAPFDLLHAYWADEPGFAAVLAGAIIRRPVVVSLGGWELTALPQIEYGAQRLLLRRLMIGYALRRATRVTAGSAYQLDLGRAEGLPEAKLRLAPLGVDTAHFRPPEAPDRRSFSTIVQAASLVPVKNQTLLLDVLSRVKVARPDIRLRLAGSGPLAEALRGLAQQLGLEQQIIWQRQLAHRATRGLYRQAGLYVQTSYHEAQGMSVLEALACGLPVVGTPVGVARELACLPPQQTAEGLAGQVIRVLGDAAFWAEQSRRAREEVERAFSLPATLDNFVRIYRDCL